MPSAVKIINDPIYGFISIPSGLIYDLIEHPYFQRLRRISQMGLSYMVYPGAHHTRFQHSTGTLHLMTKAVESLRSKGISIDDSEYFALQAAILLHDIGHGPFSHALEGIIVENRSHEDITLTYMEYFDREAGGELREAIRIYRGEHPRIFFNSLVSGQLDMDRLDYLMRDSFYTGVVEGSINSDRLIAMMNVAGGRLVVEQKALYSIEKFLLSRRFMYWQVYFHKTGFLAEKILGKILSRARELIRAGAHVPAGEQLYYFLSGNAGGDSFLSRFSMLDDHDIWVALKEWTRHSDRVLSRLSGMLVNRRLPRIEFFETPIDEGYQDEIKERFRKQTGFTDDEIPYFIWQGRIGSKVYDLADGGIRILDKNGKVAEWLEVVKQFDRQRFTKPYYRYYLVSPRKI